MSFNGEERFALSFSEVISWFFPVSLGGTSHTIQKISKCLECAECAFFLKPAALRCSRLWGVKCAREDFWKCGFCIGKVLDTAEENIFDSLRP